MFNRSSTPQLTPQQINEVLFHWGNQQPSSSQLVHNEDMNDILVINDIDWAEHNKQLRKQPSHHCDCGGQGDMTQNRQLVLNQPDDDLLLPPDMQP